MIINVKQSIIDIKVTDQIIVVILRFKTRSAM